MNERFHRGDKHPTSGLVFFRYGRGKEVWVTPAQLEDKIKKSRVIAKRGRARPKNKLKAKLYMRKYQRRPERKAKHSAYYKQPHVRERVKKSRETNPKIITHRQERAKIKAVRKTYLQSEEYLELRREKHRQWAKENREIVNAYENTRYKSDPNYRLGKLIRNRINSALRQRGGLVKTMQTERLIGCSIQSLRVHLQSQFEDWMNWENYAKEWHVDHQTPLALFDLSRPDQQLLAFNFQNLKPLKSEDNWKKSDKIEVDGKLVQARKIRTIIPFPQTKTA